MAAALVLMARGFLFMVFARPRAAAGGALVSPLWLVAAYPFHTFGELCLSPIGLSFVTKLAPRQDGRAAHGRCGTSPPPSPNSWPVSSPR